MEKIMPSPASPSVDLSQGYIDDPFVLALPYWIHSEIPEPFCFVDTWGVVYLYYPEIKTFFLQTEDNAAFRITDPRTARRLSSELKTIKQNNHVFGDREYLLFSCLHQHHWASMRFVDSFHPQSPNCPVCGLTWCVVVDTIPSSK